MTRANSMSLRHLLWRLHLGSFSRSECKRITESTQTKTVEDIRPPVQKFYGYLEHKAKPTTYAHNNGAELLKGRLELRK